MSARQHPVGVRAGLKAGSLNDPAAIAAEAAALLAKLEDDPPAPGRCDTGRAFCEKSEALGTTLTGWEHRDRFPWPLDVIWTVKG